MGFVLMCERKVSRIRKVLPVVACFSCVSGDLDRGFMS